MKIAWFAGEIHPNGSFTLMYDFLSNYPLPNPSWQHRVYLVNPRWDRGLISHLKARIIDVRPCFEEFQPSTDVWWKKLREDSADCDVIISSNITNLDEVIPDNVSMPVVSLSESEKGYRTTQGQYGSFYKSRFHKAAISKTAVEAFPEHVRGQVTVLPSGLDPSRLANKISRRDIRDGWFPGRQEGMKILLFIGAHRKSKGLDKAIQCLEYLPNNWNLLVLTPPKDLNPPDHLKARIHIGQPLFSVADVYKACDCFILPTEHEGMSRSLMECWYLGIPVVTTKHKAMLEMVANHPNTHFANLVDLEADPKALAVAVEESRASEQATQVMHQHYMANNMVEHWQSYLEKIVKI